MARVNITMPDKIWERAYGFAEELGLSLSSFCVLAVSEYMKQQDAMGTLDTLRETLHLMQRIQATREKGGKRDE